MKGVREKCNRSSLAKETRNRLFFLVVGFTIPFMIMCTHTIQAAIFISVLLTITMLIGQLLYNILVHRLSVRNLMATGICSVVIAGIVTLANTLVTIWIPMASLGSNRYAYLLCAIPAFLSRSEFEGIGFSKNLVFTIKVLLLFSVIAIIIAFIREMLTAGVVSLPGDGKSVVKLSSSGYPFFAFILCGYVIAIITRVFRGNIEPVSDEEAV